MIAFVAVAALLAAEALALYVAGELVMRIFPAPRNELVSAPGFVAIAFIAYLAPTLLDRFAAAVQAKPQAIAGLGVLVLYAALRLQYAHDLALWDFGWAADFVVETGTVKGWIPPVLVSAVLLLAVWSRAAWRARGEVWLESAPRSLALPFGLVTLVLVLTAGSAAAEIVARGGAVFYGVALVALACSQLAQGGAGIGRLRAGGVTLTLLVGTAAFAALGVLVVGVLLEPAIDLLTPPVSAALRGVFWLLTWVIIFPLAWLLTIFFEFIFSLLGDGDGSDQIQLPEPPLESEGAAGSGDDGSESLWLRIARYALPAGALFLALAVVALALVVLARLRRRAGEKAGQEAESERLGGLGGDLREAARNLFRREHRREPSGEGVVHLYLEVLESARQAGTPRAASRTPHEFAPVLIDAFHRDVTDEITAAFEHARYAGRAPDAAALADLRRRWEALD